METEVRNAEVLAIIPDGFARVNVTYGGSNGDMRDPIRYDATDGDIKAMVAEALRAGSIPGIAAQADADLSDFVIDRFPPTAEIPYTRLFARPKTAFGIRP